jgi:hypothetical protein
MINQDILNEFGGTIKTSLKGNQSRKIFSVFVELAQNIIKFSSFKSSKNNNVAGQGIIIFQTKENYYTLSAGNQSDISHINNVISKCEYLSGMNKEELKNHYQNVVREVWNSTAGGLGLIDIFRKSDFPVKIKTTKVNNSSSFLTITAMFKTGEDKDERTQY